MQETTAQIINHVRIMIEEVEYTKGKIKVSHFSSQQLMMPHSYS